MKLLVLGAGKMARAFFVGLSSQNKKDLEEISFYTPSGTRARELAHETGGQWCSTLEKTLAYDGVVLAMKPQQFQGVAIDLKARLNPGSVVISFLAGTPVAEIQQQLQIKKVARVMPNLASEFQSSAHLLTHSKELTLNEKNFLTNWLEKTGSVTVLDSDQLFNQVTPVASSYPAFLFHQADLLERDLTALGLTDAQARLLARQMMAGATQVLLERELSGAELRDQVTSKAGVTEALLKVFLKEASFDQVFAEAFKSARKRADQLANPDSLN